jgi:hypothetical protein
MLRSIDGLNRSRPPGAGLVDQFNYREDRVASVIEQTDIDFRGMLTALHLASELTEISHVYARAVVGSEGDPNCEQILDAFRREHFQVPNVGTCR